MNSWRSVAAAATLCLLTAARASPADDEATLLRVFLRDGTSLVSYGEFARVADRVVFSMPIASTVNPPLQLVSIPADRVDWARTDRYADTARAARYTATQAESDYVALNNAVSLALNDVASIRDPARRLAIVEEARRTLAEWPQSHFHYRIGDVRQMLGMLDGSGYEKTGAGSAASIHYVAEVMRRFYADRSQYFGDPDFYKVPIKKLLDPKYIASRRDSIDPLHATPSTQIRPGSINVREGTETTHFNIVDSEGNAVAVTYTLNNGYGSGVTVPGLGFLLNDEMDDFASKPGTENLFHLIQGESNAIQAGKRPVSSMTPTIVLRDGKLFLILGAPGGSRIINGVLQVLLNVVDFHMNVQDAVDWPRFHHQWMPDVLYVQKGISPDTVKLLRGMGHNVSVLDPTSGVAQVEAILNDGGWLQGASDPRGNGKAEGY